MMIYTYPWVNSSTLRSWITHSTRHYSRFFKHWYQALNLVLTLNSPHTIATRNAYAAPTFSNACHITPFVCSCEGYLFNASNNVSTTLRRKTAARKYSPRTL